VDGLGSAQRAVAVTRDDTIRIGRVTRAHGVSGELEVRPDWEHSRGLLDAREVVLESESGAREVHVVRASRQTPKGVLLALADIVDRDAAEARRGCAVWVRRDVLPSLADGEYYLCDLIGATVESPEGTLGRVVEVQMYPSVDALVIEAADGVRFEQPLLDQWIERVELGARRVLLVSRDGLIESLQPRPAARASES
jgi:16S rRNA processing protein RimM